MNSNQNPTPITTEILQKLRLIVGDGGLLTKEQLHGRMNNGIPALPNTAETLIRPRTTAEVSQVLALCHEARIPVVAQGGMTGLVHGADPLPHEIALSLERMNVIEELDPLQRTLRVQAGVILQLAQQSARDAGLQLCVDLGSRGSATVGGLASTNAGGNKVISQGMMREQILGLEVVLADGTVLDGMNALIKNNSGYDLKQLFIGSEGTLGVITRMVLRLHEAPQARGVALIGVGDYNSVCQLLRHFDRELLGGLSAFEVMWPNFYQCVSEGSSRMALDPRAHGFYVLVEAQGNHQDALMTLFQEALERAVERGWIQDAALAQSERECEDIWALRDNVARLGQFGLPMAYDISLSLSDTGPYVEATCRAIQHRWESAHVWAFGHLGDGNVHLVVCIPGMAEADRHALDSLVYGPLRAKGGAVSAEHGIGTEKMAWLHVSRTPAELATMKMIKKALDPRGILNPGRVIATLDA